MPGPLISVCVLAGHGLRALDACLGSLGGQVSPPPFELLVGGAATPEILSVVHSHFPAAQVCQTSELLPGAARNPLIEHAQGELLLFLDDDVTVPGDLLARLAHTAALHPRVTVFGGPNITPFGSSRFQVLQGAVLSSVVGAGPVSRRYGARHGGFADERWFTLCNLAIRRRVMLPFVTELVCAEENALLSQLRSHGEKMLYEPRLRVFHSRRPTLQSFAKQMCKYGRGRGQLLARRPGTFRLAYLMPATLVVYLLLLAVMLPITTHQGLVLAPAALYCLLTIATGLRIGWTLRSLTDGFLAAALIPIVHLCYGSGVLRGLFSPGQGRFSPRRRSGEGAAREASALPTVQPLSEAHLTPAPSSVRHKSA